MSNRTPAAATGRDASQSGVLSEDAFHKVNATSRSRLRALSCLAGLAGKSDSPGTQDVQGPRGGRPYDSRHYPGFARKNASESANVEGTVDFRLCDCRF